MRLLTFFFVICLFTFATITHGKSVSAENKNAEENLGENEHNLFFQRLSDAEKAWLMDVSIHYDMEYRKPGELPEIEQPDVPEIEEPSPIGYSAAKSNEFVPFPISDETPDSLITGMLNGQIPSGWQKRFTMWLRTHYNLTNYNFDHYKRFKTFCPPAQSSCPGFGDIGAECCPWG